MPAPARNRARGLRQSLRAITFKTVFQLLTGHQILTPLVVSQVRLPFQAKDAVSVRERNRVERTPESRREHANGLVASRHHHLQCSPAIHASAAAAAAAAPATRSSRAGARRSHARRRQGRLDLLVRPL